MLLSIIRIPCLLRLISINLIKEDPDDNKFVDCAVAGSAKFIVSEDRHYNILKTVDFPRVEVLGLDEMMETFAVS